MSIALKDLRKISPYEWEIPKSYRRDMQVPVRVFASREFLEDAVGDASLDQAVNAATLPGLVGQVIVMPDIHQGYGFPIGGIAATRYPDGVISPGGIGYDINCGVRLMSTSILLESVHDLIGDLATRLDAFCPSGVGSEGAYVLDEDELAQVCREGAHWARKRGFAEIHDLEHTEEQGRLTGADPDKLSPRARQRGRSQLGTLGSGNHFIEVDLVEQIFNEKAAQVMGLHQDCLALQIHCGSRGLGHQVCTDYVHLLQGAVQRYGIKLPDRELVCAPLDSSEGRDYLAAMQAAANYAFANRQLLAHNARRAFEEVLAGQVKHWHLHQVYDIAHNMGKIETHIIDGIPVKVCVHRKGATRAFGPGSPDLPADYQQIGQPVLVPGSMGTGGWVLTATAESMAKAFGSSCHGAGRVMSRSKAKHEVRGDKLREELEAKGIHIRAGSLPGLAEEAPSAYKDVDEVVQIVVNVGIAQKVARLRPIAVIKG